MDTKEDRLSLRCKSEGKNGPIDFTVEIDREW